LLTNNTNDTISFPIQDASLIGIVEAQDKDRIWRPIQFWPISGCGNSYYSEYLLPKQTLIFKVKNDFGEVRTTMRLKLHGNDTIYISDEFEGTVESSIFEKPNDAHKSFRHLMCDSVFYLEKPFYGDLNIEYDEIEILELED
jgi:hypothetical protein